MNRYAQQVAERVAARRRRRRAPSPAQWVAERVAARRRRRRAPNPRPEHLPTLTVTPAVAVGRCAIDGCVRPARASVRATVPGYSLCTAACLEHVVEGQQRALLLLALETSATGTGR